MPMTNMRILMIGEILPVTREILRRFAARGCGSQNVVSIGDAKAVLENLDFDVVLATESLCDGRGYDIAEVVTDRSGTLMVGVALSDTRLWLPVVERGVNVLGRRALNVEMLELEMEKLLGLKPPVLDDIRATARNDVRAGARDTAQEGIRETLRNIATERERIAPRDNVRPIAPKPAASAGGSFTPQTATPNNSTMLRRKYRDRDKLPI